MTPAEKLAALQAWQVAIERADKLINPVIEALQLTPESPPCEAVWGLQGALTAAVAAQVGDSFEWLNWYAHENNFGAVGHVAGPVGATRKIRTLEDLLWLIEANN
jgi:hypothetical protein